MNDSTRVSEEVRRRWGAVGSQHSGQDLNRDTISVLSQQLLAFALFRAPLSFSLCWRGEGGGMAGRDGWDGREGSGCSWPDIGGRSLECHISDIILPSKLASVNTLGHIMSHRGYSGMRGLWHEPPMHPACPMGVRVRVRLWG